MFSVDGADINNVTISNISMRKSQAVIQLRLGNRLRAYELTEAEKPKHAGQVCNFMIRQLQAMDIESSQDFILGIPDTPWRT